MDLNISDRRALVTGSTSGIGYAIAEGLAAEGVIVTITGRSQRAMDGALARMGEKVPHARVEGVVADCGTAGGAEAVLARTPDVDILVNNLGIYERKPVFEIPDVDWLRLFEINVLSGVRFARYYGPRMAKNGWGRILFISSESGLTIPREMVHYGMTKTAQLSISRGMAIELAGTGVTVNAVLPGPTRTATTERQRAERAKAAGMTVAELESEFFADYRPTSLTKRFASADEVANLVVYLSSHAASATTGAALRVDGGVVNQIM